MIVKRQERARAQRLHIFAFVLALAFALGPTTRIHAQSAQALVADAAKAMGGHERFARAQESDRRKRRETIRFVFDAAAARSDAPDQQLSLQFDRQLGAPRVRLEWDGRNSARNEPVRFVEVIDGAVGSLQEGDGKTAKSSRLHPGRLATRLREEKRAPVNLVLMRRGE